MADIRQTMNRSNLAHSAGTDRAEREEAASAERGPQPGSAQQPSKQQPAGAGTGTAGPPAGGTPPHGPAAAPAPAATADGADENALRADVDQLVALAAQRDEYLALAQRTQADFENFRKRVVKESAAAQERGVAKLAKELLPALDNLDRALAEATAAAERDGGEHGLLEGVRLVRSELHAALARVGVESFAPVGVPFDPAEHEAMASRAVPGAPAGSVAEVFQPGYRLGPAIIRPARVLVAE